MICETCGETIKPITKKSKTGICYYKTKPICQECYQKIVYPRKWRREKRRKRDVGINF